MRRTCTGSRFYDDKRYGFPVTPDASNSFTLIRLSRGPETEATITTLGEPPARLGRGGRSYRGCHSMETKCTRFT